MGNDADLPKEFLFADEEILEQLQSLGFQNVTHEQLRIFKQELLKFLQQDAVTSSDFDLQQKDEDDRITTAKKDVEQETIDIDCPRTKKPQYVLIEKLGPIQQGDFRNCRSPMSRPVSSSTSISRSMLTSEGDVADAESGKRHSPEADSTKESSGYRYSSCERLPKRKVLRRRNGSVLVCDETFHTDICWSSSLSSDVKASKPHISPDENTVMQSSVAKRSSDGQNRSSSVSNLKKWRSTSDLNCREFFSKSKSVILPYYKEQRGLMYFKTDPVALYHFYKKEWALHNIPGERDHRQLRWNIRSMMSVKDVFSRTQSRSSLMTT